MNKIVIAGLALLIVTGMLLSGCTTLQQKETSLSIVGTSDIKVMPDLVVIYYDIQSNASTASAAGDANARISNALKNALIGLGFIETDIQTHSYSINPDYIYDYKTGQQIPNGYKATQQIKLEFPTKNTDLIGKSIDAGINAGATIDYINFELSPSVQANSKTEALKEATADSHVKAEAVASELGRSIGRIDSVSTSDISFYPVRMYDMITASNAPVAKVEATNIQPSSQDVTAQVTVVYILT